jgi:oligoribonuclease NrnB/cAMP/cGMP phosphodiesterase (DHH superfamily)
MFNIFKIAYQISPIDMQRYESYAALCYVIERISAYDTWEWKNNPYKYVIPDIVKDRNLKIEEDFTTVLIQMLGIESVYEIFKKRAYSAPYHISILIEPDKLYGDELTSLYFAKKRKDKEDVDMAIKNVRVIKNCSEFNNLNIAIFIQDRGNPSIIGNKIVTDYPYVDLVVILFINSKTISLRSDESKIDCSVIAKERGGGGHPAASGFKAVDDTDILKYIDLYFSTKNYLIQDEN